MVPILIQTFRLLRALRQNRKLRRVGKICCRASQAKIPKWYSAQIVQESREGVFRILLKCMIKRLSHRAVSDGYFHPIRSHQRIILIVESQMLLAKKENIAKVKLKS